MSKVAFAFDLHDTLTQSTLSWIKGYTDQLPHSDDQTRQLIEALLQTKISRRKISQFLGLSHKKIEELARFYLKPEQQMITFIHYLYKKEIPLFLISNGTAERVHKDLERLQLQKYWTQVYTQKDGIKPDKNYVERILSEHDLDLLIMIGNDPKEDVWFHEKTLCLQLPSEKGNLCDESN